jgi:hypothetical protein
MNQRSPARLSRTSWLILLAIVAYWGWQVVGGQSAAPPPLGQEGLRVLIVEDVEQRATLPVSQRIIFSDPAIREYLDQHCTKDASGNPEYRILDHQLDMTNAPPVWRDAMKRPRKSLPWIIISAPPRGGTEGPLPANSDETLALLKRWGGA